MAQPACECAHGRFSAYFNVGVYLNCCLHLLSPNVKEYVCAWLEAQEETLKSSFFILSSPEELGNGMGKGREEKYVLFPHFPSSLFCLFVCKSPSVHTVEHSTVLTIHEI